MSSVNIITISKGNNIGINNNTYQYNFQQGSYRIEEDSEICVNKAVIPNSIYNMTGNNNNYFYYSLPMYSPNLSSSTTITGYIQGQYVEITSITNGTVSVGNYSSFITDNSFLLSQVSGTPGGVGLYISNSTQVSTLLNLISLPSMITTAYTQYAAYGSATLQPALNTSAKLNQFVSNYTFTRTNDNIANTMSDNSFLLIATNFPYTNLTYTNLTDWQIEQNYTYNIYLMKGTGGALNFNNIWNNNNLNPNLGYSAHILGIAFARSDGGNNRYAILRRTNYIPITKDGTFEFSFYSAARYYQGTASLVSVDWTMTKYSTSGNVSYTNQYNPPSSSVSTTGLTKYSLTFTAIQGDNIDVSFLIKTNQGQGQDITVYFSKIMIRDKEYDNRVVSGSILASGTLLSNAYYGWSSLYALSNTQTSSTAYSTTPTTSYFSTGNTITVASAIIGALVGDLVISTTHNALIPYGTYIQSITSSTVFVLANNNVDLFITPFGVGVGILTAIAFYHPVSCTFGTPDVLTTLPQQTAYKVSLSAGYYDVSTLNTALINAQNNYNTVFSNSVSKKILYPLQLSYNTTLLRSTLTAIFIPTSSGNVVSQLGSNWVWSQGLYPTTSYAGRLYFDNNNIASSLLGFSNNAFTPTTLTAYDSNSPFPLITNSPSVPYYQYVNAILLRCNLVNNKVEATSDIVGTIPLLQPFESNINYNPNKYCWVKIRPGIYSSLVLTLTDQYKNPLTLNDNNVLIQLLIRKT